MPESKKLVSSKKADTPHDNPPENDHTKSQQQQSKDSHAYHDVHREWPRNMYQQSPRQGEQQNQRGPAYSMMQRWHEERTCEQPYNNVGSVKITRSKEQKRQGGGARDQGPSWSVQYYDPRKQQR